MTTNKVKIFIASSAEVKEERDECILHINQVNKSHKHLHLEAVEWEYDLPHGSYPDFDTVQRAIDPMLEECELCVFIFYSKIGKYTQEEFDLANQLGIPLFAYFREGFSPGNKQEILTYSELIEFKDEMGETIIYKNYGSTSNFGELLKDNLHIFLSKEFPVPSTSQNLQLSDDVKTLMKILTEKQEEIDQLKSEKLSLANSKTNHKLIALEKEKQELLDELNSNKEIQQQQAKEKEELEQRLAPQIVSDKLKEKALTAIGENNYKEAEILLKESAEDTISETASTFFELGKLKKIQLLFKDAFKYFELAVRIKPNNPDFLKEIGSLLRNLGKYDSAISHLQHALEELEKSDEPDSFDIANLNIALGNAFYDKGELDNAIGHYENVTTIDPKILKENPGLIATSNNGLGIIYLGKGEYDRAIEYHTKAINEIRNVFEENHIQFSTAYNNLGLAHNYKGEYDIAIEYYDKALSIDISLYGDEHPEIGIHYNNIGSAYRNKKEYLKAIECYEKALTISIKFLGEEHPRIASIYNNLGVTYDLMGDLNHAIEFLQKAVEVDNKVHPDGHPEIATRLNNIGAFHRSNGELDLAIELFLKALDIDKKFLGEEHPNIAMKYFNLGATYYLKNEFKLALDHYEIALSMYTKFLPSTHGYIIQLQSDIQYCLEQIRK